MNTKHFSTDNAYREMLINAIGGEGNVILTNVIDRGHKNGPERFELTDNGIIRVFNNITDRRITTVFARVGQLYSRFGDKFEQLPIEVQRAVKAKCREYQDKGYNEL